MSIPRRTVLLAVGSSVAIAGCLGDDESDEDPSDDGIEDSTDDGTQTDDSDGSGDEDSESENENETDNEGGSGATVRVRSHPDLGDILVGPEGLTLYNFDQDTQDEMASTCYEGCAEAWPPLTVEGEPTTGDGVSATLTTFERDDGETQVATDGWPLYYFASDEEPGDVNGQGVNDVWWVLAPDGTPVRPDDDGDSDGDTSNGTDDTDDSDGDDSEDDDNGVGY
ncbi:COG4315 family predicted lipoprotein [Natronosalvus halobius]|uniref:COG4315 family predicted lipoprotein n=1 Tax=Natronosalvus halobius TaxID=2953746 RepID=UPI00209FD17C|nr:hypothetical protein [Natronosalvus halobius]USZ73313.1 hypothetical protein NGM15_08450 [Natronosalvus halobius]